MATALVLAALTWSPSASHAGETGHVLGAGVVVGADGCVEVVSIHVSREPHPGQYVAYERRCSGMAMVRVEEEVRCLRLGHGSAVVGTATLIVRIVDGGPWSDSVDVWSRPPRRRCPPQGPAPTGAVVGDFIVEGPRR